MKIPNNMQTFEDSQRYLRKKYNISEVHAGCYLCNCWTEFLCRNCHHCEECKQIKEMENA